MTSPSLATSPRIGDWIDVEADGTIVARTGKSELGQGISTALAQIVAEEMGVDPGRVRLTSPTTEHSPDEGFTAGSLSIQHSGTALRWAARAARSLFEGAAAAALQSPIERVDGGTFVSTDSSVSYADLRHLVNLDVDIEGVPTADVEPARGAIGESLPRRDLPDKVLGRPSFIQDLRMPGMRFGRMVRPAFRGARLIHVPNGLELPGGATIVRNGNVVGVVAAREIHAIAAVAIVAAECRWEGTPEPLDGESVREWLTAAPAAPAILSDGPEPGASATRATYTRPFVAHASIGTSCAIAQIVDGRVEVWSHTQGVYPLRRDISRALGVPEETVAVHHVEGAGCYGHNPADDVAYDAVLLAQALPGIPIQVTWSREDELGWAPFAPAMSVTIASETDTDGTLRSWSWDGFGNGHTSRPTALPSPSLLAFSHQDGGMPIPASADPPMAAGEGTGRNAVPAYRVPGLRAVSHRLTSMPLRASAMRSLGAYVNVFAIESHMDDLAHDHGIDPVEYRLRHLDDPRARMVIEAAAQMSDWGAPVANDRGRGLGFARYKNTGAWCAVVAEVETVDRVVARHLWIAVDCGRVVNPDGVVNQIEGGAIQSVSWTLVEEVRFADGVVTSTDWESYPILRFTDVPTVETTLVDRPDEPWLGAGEAASGPTAAALGNAVRAALGIRIRDLPITPERIIERLGD